MITTIAIIVALIMSAVVHEVAHGWMALRQGDTTARDAGRLTLNPLKHLDWFGSVLLPLVLVLSKVGFFLAWAKPVPINPMRFKDVKYGELKVAAAGPVTNFILAIIFGIFSQILPISANIKISLINTFLGGGGNSLAMIGGSFVNSLYLMAVIFVLINLVLGFFNLIPWPPLDGSRIIFPFMPRKIQDIMAKIEYSPFSMLFLLALVYLGVVNVLMGPVIYLFGMLTGLS